jgi:hypothetical protein
MRFKLSAMKPIDQNLSDIVRARRAARTLSAARGDFNTSRVAILARAEWLGFSACTNAA